MAAHQHAYFKGHTARERRWPVGPIEERVPGLYVHEFGPGPRFSGWTYVTVGLWEAMHRDDGHGLELVLSSPEQSDRAVELLTMTAFFHAGPDSQRLDLGHTMPIGEPWLPGSACDHLLVCLPYVNGPELEHCEWSGGHARHVWLLPITQAERDHKSEFGLESLEQRLDTAAVVPIDVHRHSVV